ncbi:hypothetical protein PAEPH01_1902 [Pancytospora epiphaga]|nr:hypothetical protein PAEPH01_1902 [Pancytospora epiphaga]
MFKKQRIAKEEAKEAKFKEPTVKRCKKKDTHTGEHSDITRITLLSRIPARRKTFYRSIVELTEKSLDQNIYIICGLLFQTMLDDRNIEKLFYTALGRILRSSSSESVNSLCVDYLIAQLAMDRAYTTLLEYFLRHCSGALVPRKTALMELVDDPRLQRSLQKLTPPEVRCKLLHTDSIYYVRQF